MHEAFSKNFIDYEEYPVTADIQNRCVSMIARMYNCPTDDDANVMGTSTIGSSEAIMLGTLAMKKRWQNKRKAAGKPYDKPNIVMNSAVQVCWEKAARYFDIEEKYVYCTNDRFVIDPKQAVDLVDENTIGICAIIGTSRVVELLQKITANAPQPTLENMKTSRLSTTFSRSASLTATSMLMPPVEVSLLRSSSQTSSGTSGFPESFQSMSLGTNTG